MMMIFLSSVFSWHPQGDNCGKFAKSAGEREFERKKLAGGEYFISAGNSQVVPAEKFNVSSSLLKINIERGYYNGRSALGIRSCRSAR